MVGEGGLSPSYFFDEMGARETQDYIDGLARRRRTAWEVGRELMRVVAAAGGCKRFDFPLPWDKDNKPAPEVPDAAELARLKRQAEKIGAALKAREDRARQTRATGI